MTKAVRLRVDWASCDGHGLCAQWAPEVVTLDEWGFPVLPAGAVPAAAVDAARDAVRACPVLALRLLPLPPT